MYIQSTIGTKERLAFGPPRSPRRGLRRSGHAFDIFLLFCFSRFLKNLQKIRALLPSGPTDSGGARGLSYATVCTYNYKYKGGACRDGAVPIVSCGVAQYFCPSKRKFSHEWHGEEDQDASNVEEQVTYLRRKQLLYCSLGYNVCNQQYNLRNLLSERESE